MIDLLQVLWIAFIAIAFIEWLKRPLPNAPTWVWWGLAPVVCVALGFVKAFLPAGVMLGLLAFAVATLFYDHVIQWAKKKIEELG